MRKTVELSTRSFDTQGQATLFFRGMLNRYKPGDLVTDEDALDLAALLRHHHEYVMKVGGGIDRFEVRMTGHGTQCFYIIRTDGTGTDFSYGTCIRGKPPSVKGEVIRAFRDAVKFDLYKARDEFFSTYKDTNGLVPCAKTGELISREEGHMDHLPPTTFEVLVDTFIKSRGMRYDDVPLTSGQDNQVCPEITHPGLREAFRTFHERAARLDFVKDVVNLGQSSRNRLKVGRIKITNHKE